MLTLNNLRHSILFELVRKAYSLIHIPLALNIDEAIACPKNKPAP
jgi:hypothetical protein